MASTEHTRSQVNREMGQEVIRSTPPQAISPYAPFDPKAGTTVIEPHGVGKGWWVGAPSVYWDGNDSWLAYRVRRPQPERGGLFQIAQSHDGERFQVICSIRKEDLGTSSIERGALLKAEDGKWLLYLSFVDPADGRWRIDLLEADHPSQFDAATRIPILTAADIGAEGVKDPWVCKIGDVWHMIVSWAPTPDGEISPQEMHGTRDIYNTGTSKSLTGLATSTDGLTWKWEGTIFEPSQDGWDEYAARINTVYRDGDHFVGLYDGSKHVSENYEERCGLAISNDLRTWVRISVDGPAVGPNGGPGSVRYAEVVQGPNWVRFYYEFTREDGSHELRTVLVQP